jgi:DNA polymerase III subunit epsilon
MNDNYKHKLCFVDLETTGLDRKKNDIFQLSAIITDPSGDNVLDKITLSFKPYQLNDYEEAAFEKTGVTLEYLNSLELDSLTARDIFIDFLKKHVDPFNKSDKLQFIAYNAPFDSEFLREWWNKANDPYFGSLFWNPPICVMQAAAWFVRRVRGALFNFKLGTICEAAELGWDDSKAHDAEYDITKTLELYRYLSKTMH